MGNDSVYSILQIIRLLPLKHVYCICCMSPYAVVTLNSMVQGYVTKVVNFSAGEESPTF
jgi:hypothetical protein